MMMTEERLDRVDATSRYDGSVEHDCLLVEWWTALVTTDDIDLMLMPQCRHLDSFLSYFRLTALLMFCRSPRTGRIIRAMWVEPLMSGAYVSVWLHQRHRRTQESAMWLRGVFREVFEKVPVLVAVTKQERLVTLFTHFGFHFLGRVPYLWAGEDVWVFTMTQENLDNGRRRRR